MFMSAMEGSPMRILFSIPAVLMAISLTLTGCGSMRGGQNVVKFEEGQPPMTTTAPSAGTYALYSLTDYSPKVTLQLNQGDTIGFKPSQTGEVLAVAGNREIPLSANTSYYWKKQS
jgi:hypothetical protein